MQLFVFFISLGLVLLCEIKKESIIGVQWGQKDPNQRVHHSSGKRGLPSFSLNGRLEVGLFLELLNTNDRLFFSYTNSTFSDCMVRYCLTSAGDET